jgi:hypothetical protein
LVTSTIPPSLWEVEMGNGDKKIDAIVWGRRKGFGDKLDDFKNGFQKLLVRSEKNSKNEQEPPANVSA